MRERHTHFLATYVCVMCVGMEQTMRRSWINGWEHKFRVCGKGHRSACLSVCLGEYICTCVYTFRERERML